MSKFTTIRLAHELDAAWIIALWKAIHGGDPAPEQIAAEAIAALSGTLTHAGASASESSFAELQTRLKEIGVDLQRHMEGNQEAALSADSPVARTYCILYKGQRICITLPRPFVWPPRQ